MAETSPERRLLLAFALSVVVLTLWAAYMREKYPPAQPPAEAPQVSPTSPPAPPPPIELTTPPPAPAAGTVEVKQGTEERTIRVETDTATVEFSTRGAVVRSWTLKNFRDPDGKPLELVQGRATRLGYPLAFSVADRARQDALNNALFTVNAPAGTLHAPAELLFEWSDGRLAARKRLRFGGPFVELETSLSDNGASQPHLVAWAGGFGEAPHSTGAIPGQVFVRTPAGLKRQLAQHAGEEESWLWVWRSPSPFPYAGEASYAGIEDQYFVAVFLPQRPGLRVGAWTSEWTPPGENQKPQKIGAVAVGAPEVGPLRLYVGPKSIAALEGLEAPPLSNGSRPALEDELVDFGWFWWVAKPLFWAMAWIYERWISNYGWAIVVLTIIINAVLFPFKWKSMESAFKMQKLAPQLRAIQARYKQYKFNDPRRQQQQQEVMALYRQHGVNPLGGCLPLLLQIPFFIAFYKVLAVSIEMRQAHWFGWIHDLSQPDPYYILPILMTVTMYISTRMTPMTTTDPVQQRMMQLFPLIFGITFLSFSAGLVLYWMVSNVVGIAQQAWINAHFRHRDEAEKLGAKERKKKKRQPEGGAPRE